MYLYSIAKSNNELYKSESKNKDTSKLSLVTRTVIRNGKPTTLRFYEDPNKNFSNPVKSPSTDISESSPVDNGAYLCGNELGKPIIENIKKAVPPGSWFTVGKVNKNIYDAVFLVSDEKIYAILGLYKTTDGIEIKYVSSVDSVLLGKAYYAGLCFLVKTAYDEGKGICAEDFYSDFEKINNYLFTFLGIKGKKISKEKYFYKADQKKLEQAFGEKP